MSYKFIVTPSISNYIPPFQDSQVFDGRGFIKNYDLKNSSSYCLLHEGTQNKRKLNLDPQPWEFDCEVLNKKTRYSLFCSSTDLKLRFRSYYDKNRKPISVEFLNNNELDEIFTHLFGLEESDNKDSIRGTLIEDENQEIPWVIISPHYLNEFGNVLLVKNYNDDYFINYANLELLNLSKEIMPFDDVNDLANNCIDYILECNL